MELINLNELTKMPIKYLNGYINTTDITKCDYLYDQTFIDLISKIKDIECYRSIINNLSNKIDVTIIERKRQIFYTTIINSYDSKSKLIHLYSQFLEDIQNNSSKNIELYLKDLYHHNLYEAAAIIRKEINQNGTSNIHQTLIKLTQKYIIDIIIDKLYQDIYPNVIMNIYELLNFENNLPYKVIDKDIKDIYKLTTNLQNLTNDELINIYHKFKSLNLSSYLYSDIRKCKNISYKLLNTSLVNEATLSNTKDIDLSSKTGVNIYNLQGEKFCAMIHASGISKVNSNIKNNYKQSNNAGACSCSIIDETHLDTFQNPHDYIVFGFENFDINSVIHVYHNDSFSDNEYASLNDTLPTNNVNKIYTKEMLMNDSTDGYNEILIKIKQNNITKNTTINTITPSLQAKYILCYDKITSFDIEYAKTHNYYIVLIHTKYYPKQEKTKIKEEKYITYGDIQYHEYRHKKYT